MGIIVPWDPHLTCNVEVEVCHYVIVEPLQDGEAAINVLHPLHVMLLGFMP